MLGEMLNHLTRALCLERPFVNDIFKPFKGVLKFFEEGEAKADEVL